MFPLIVELTTTCEETDDVNVPSLGPVSYNAFSHNHLVEAFFHFLYFSVDCITVLLLDDYFTFIVFIA